MFTYDVCWEEYNTRMDYCDNQHTENDPSTYVTCHDKSLNVFFACEAVVEGIEAATHEAEMLKQEADEAKSYAEELARDQEREREQMQKDLESDLACEKQERERERIERENESAMAREYEESEQMQNSYDGN